MQLFDRFYDVGRPIPKAKLSQLGIGHLSSQLLEAWKRVDIISLTVDPPPKLFPQSGYKLKNPLNIVVLAANKAHRALEWILPQAANAE